MKSGCNGENNDYSIITYYASILTWESKFEPHAKRRKWSIVSISSRFHLRETKNQKHAYRTTVVPLYTRSSLVCTSSG